MKRYVNWLKQERGLTLIELLAVLSISSLVLGLIYSITIFGMNTYNKIEVEGQMRDEADIIMSTIFQQLYTIGAGEVEQAMAEDGNALQYGITLKKTNAFGGVLSATDVFFVENGLQILADGKNQMIELTTATVDPGSTIQVSCSDSSEQACTHGMIAIELVLKSNKHNKELQLESKFGF